MSTIASDNVDEKNNDGSRPAPAQNGIGEDHNQYGEQRDDDIQQTQVPSKVEDNPETGTPSFKEQLLTNENEADEQRLKQEESKSGIQSIDDGELKPKIEDTTVVENDQGPGSPYNGIDVDDRIINSHTGATPLQSAPDASSEQRKTRSRNMPSSSASIYGMAITVTATGNFPNVGSVLGPFFCLGKLGKGTFSSIHKCINMSFNPANPSSRRLAAAKVELSDFQQSGVLESEATILDFLHRSLPPGTVPVYMGHYKCDKYAAILMEYLPGEDMHQLREKVNAGSNTRRIAPDDAVFLTADVMLPLLQRLHEVGMVHRDVKPSNVVRANTTDKQFCLVDFGLSKSIAVPADSEFANTEKPWTGQWLRPVHYNGPGAYRKERGRADFRGTSMYASLRVHQGKDYCPRDDMWSLLYVFCDLISGGLPWMQHAANRDRDACQALKERVHGENGIPDETAQLLMGDLYHVAVFRRERLQASATVEEEKLPPLPEPLCLSHDAQKVGLLRTAFAHLAGLGFCDKPDYELIKDCIKGFLVENREYVDLSISPISWDRDPSPVARKRDNLAYPEWELAETGEYFPDDLFEIDQSELETERSTMGVPSELPLEFRYRIAQMRYRAENPDSPHHMILHDWMRVVLPLLYREWDSKSCEDGGHRTATDGFRRDRYLALLEECDSIAKRCFGFRSSETFYEFEGVTKKRRKIAVRASIDYGKQNLVYLSRALFGLQTAIMVERAKKPPPPMRISFS